MLPEHPVEYVVVYPDTDEAETLYFPGFSVTVVPKDEPANDAGFGLLPETVIVKSDGILLPPDTFVVTLRVPNNPGGGIGKGASPGKILWFRTGGVGKGASPGKILWSRTGVFFFAA
jgi:hypothetical protein